MRLLILSVYFNCHMYNTQQIWKELANNVRSLYDGLLSKSMDSLGGWRGPKTLA